MRWFLVLLAACAPSDGHCTTDGDCGGGNVCARDGQCWADGDVRAMSLAGTNGPSFAALLAALAEESERGSASLEERIRRARPGETFLINYTGRPPGVSFPLISAHKLAAVPTPELEPPEFSTPRPSAPSRGSRRGSYGLIPKPPTAL